jgi:arylsulfatase A-like enzyme
VSVPFFSPQTWPDLTDDVQGNRQQQDYLNRLNLDRMEQLLSVDRMVGEVVDAAGPNTVVMFTSDNGHFGGQHRLGNKLTPQEESVHVPLYISGPGVVPRQMTQLVANIDIAPTVIDYAGRSWTNPDFNVDGRSLRPMLEGGSGGKWRSSLLLEFHKPRGLPGGDSPTDWRFGLPDYLGLRQVHGTGGAMTNSLYVQYYNNVDNPASVSEVEQYDMNTDPSQINNLATGQIGAIDQILRDFYVASGPEARVQDTRVWPA